MARSLNKPTNPNAVARPSTSTDADEREAKIQKYKSKAAQVQRDFASKTKELSRARRHLASGLSH